MHVVCLNKCNDKNIKLVEIAKNYNKTRTLNTNLWLRCKYLVLHLGATQKTGSHVVHVWFAISISECICYFVGWHLFLLVCLLALVDLTCYYFILIVVFVVVAVS